MRKFIYLCIISFGLSGCGDMLSAMSSMNQEMGGTCISYDAYYYLDYKGKWVQSKIVGTSSGERSVNEERWITGQINYYLSRRTFGNYYVTSPNSGADYKINIHCGQWY